MDSVCKDLYSLFSIRGLFKSLTLSIKLCCVTRPSPFAKAMITAWNYVERGVLLFTKFYLSDKKSYEKVNELIYDALMFLYIRYAQLTWNITKIVIWFFL